MKIIVIGGVAGGATAAARIRRLDEKSEITIFERGEHISFANCGLPYHIGDIIKDRDKLILETPDSFKNKLNINIKIKSEVLSINKEEKFITVKNLDTGGTYDEYYDYLLLSPGAKPLKPSIEGVDGYNVFSLRNILDMDNIINYINNNQAKRAVVIGGGFIGVEIAENLKHRKLNVSLIEMADQIMAPLDFDMASILHDKLIENGIDLFLKKRVDKILQNKDFSKVILNDGNEIETDLIIMASGVNPETKLAINAGLKTGKSGIEVNEYMQTSNEFIYAVGDAVEINHFQMNQKVLMPLAGPANRQGRIAANNIILNNKEKYEGTIGTSIIKVFDITAASTGLNEKRLKSLKIKYQTSIINGNSNAGYYPGALPMNIKLLFGEKGEIFGAQIVGYKGVDKRIDILSTSIKSNMKIWDLEGLELAYAPPFGSAKDPINISGYVANNILKGDLEIIHWNEIDKNDNDYIILDIRTKEEQLIGKIEKENSIHIPLNELRNNLNKLSKNKTYITYCQFGLRGYLAYRILKLNGFKAKNLDGGFKIYSYATKKIINTNNIINNNLSNNNKDFFISEENILKLDACGLQCPGPIMETYNKLKDMKEGEIVEISATDPGFKNDIEKWADKTGNKLIDIKIENGIIKAKLLKGTLVKNNSKNIATADNKTLVVFSNDLDKALASFVIASGAASMGKKVTMFFTFWGLNILRKDNYEKSLKKSFIENMFGKMMPKGPKNLKLSKMNFLGFGTKMMKNVMKNKNIDQLEIMMEKAMKAGVNLLACQMSMDMMGIKKEELIDGVDIGGVATYLSETEDSNLNLFI